MSNLRLALRTLAKTPFVTSVAVLSLALGIGANAAMFSLFNEMLLRSLPISEPARLVNLRSPGPKSGSTSCGDIGECDAVFSYPMFRDLERVQTVFTGIAAHVGFGASLASGSQTEGGDGLLVSGSYFSVLGVQPALGRLLGPDDDRAPGAGRVVVISHEYWRRRFESRPDVIGQALTVNGLSMTVVGVAPQTFRGTTLGQRPALFVPISMREALVPRWTGLANRRSYWAYLFARLKPGISIDQARASLHPPYRAILNDVEAPLQSGMSPATLVQFRAKTLLLDPGGRGQSTLQAETREPLILLLCVTGVVLLICCGNIANLLLVRAANRSTEMAVRLSIGANRRQIIGQLLTESCVLGLLGGACGLLVARWTLDAMSGILPADGSANLDLQLDGAVVMFAAVLSIGTGGRLFGLFPAWHSTRPDLVSALKANAGQPSGAKSAARFRVTLATAQIALSMALLASAGLFTRSLVNITRVDLGLNREKLVVFSIAPALNGYAPERTRAFFASVEEELLAHPGVSAVSASMVPLLSGSNYGTNVVVQGFDGGPDADMHSMYNFIGPRYFETLGIPLLSGRDFTASDTVGAPKVAIVNEAFVRKFNLGRDAVGKRMRRGGGKDLDIEIVGLSRNAKYSEVKGEVSPLFMMPYRQDPDVAFANFYVRTTLGEDQLLSGIPAVIRRIDPNLPVSHLQTMDTVVRENVLLDRFITSMSAAFACLATLLAAIGLYGVLAYTVAQRTREFGLRMALGADAANVRGLVLRQVVKMTLAGGVVGLAAALAVGRAAKSLLFGMEGHDPAVFAAAAVALTLVAMSAGFIPAYRASRVNPMSALRYE